MADGGDQGLVKLWNQVLLEELEVNVHFWLVGGLCLACSRRSLLSSVRSLLSKISDCLFENLMENRFEHPPRIRYFIHDLAEDLQAQEHVQNDFSIVGKYLIFLNHLLI